MSRVRLSIAQPEVLPPEPSSPEGDDEVFLVGDLAKAAGKTVRAIHLYEDMGLLKPERSKGRYRIFGSDALVRVRWITKLQNLGFSLAEIQQLTRAHDGSESAMLAAARLREVYVGKLSETRDKLKELKRLESELIESLHYLGNCDTSCQPQLPVNACPTCERHPENTNPPDLVVGAQTH
jgi:MerR family transcriptional regulator, copper efflux regulator